MASDEPGFKKSRANEDREIAGLVLAAGKSSRMGQDKALLAYRGRTFLDHIVQSVREAGIERLVVVLGHHAEKIRRGSHLEDVKVVVNHRYVLGQTSSLQAGLAALEHADAILLCLVDHPAVSPDTVRRITQAFLQTGAPVVVPTYQGRRGHPVLIGQGLFEELKDLSPDRGANTVIQKYRDVTQLLSVDDPGVGLDVDEPETYARLATPP